MLFQRILCGVALLGFSVSLSHAQPTGLRYSAEEYMKAGQELKAKKDYDLAKVAYLAALKKDPNNVKAMTELAWLCNETKEYNLASGFSLMALKKDESCADAWREGGYAMLQLGKTEHAIASFTLALKHNPRDVVALKYRAQAYEKLGMQEQADKDMERAREIVETTLSV